MNTKEAIEFCKNQQNYNYNGQNEEIQRCLRIFNYGLEEVISLLQQGEKYQQIVERVENEVVYNDEGNYKHSWSDELIGSINRIQREVEL